jgi:DNA-binding transcriptional LysR family regulator
MSIIHRMNTDGFELLRAFCVLMSERNVSRAAERLNLSQPAMSHALARLRKLFQDPLLSRSRGGMTATERAVAIEPHIKAILREFDAVVAAPEKFDPRKASRTFVLTATEYSEFVLLPALMARIRAEAPGIRIEIRAPDQNRMLDWLEAGEVDLRIAWVRDPIGSLRSRTLFQDSLVCIAREHHPKVGDSLTLSQFLSLPHVRPQVIGRATTAQVIDEAVAARGGKIWIGLALQNYLTIPQIVATSDFIATLPRRLVDALAPRLPIKLLEPPFRVPKMRYAAFWHDRSHTDAGHQWLRRVIAETAKQLQEPAELR